VAFFIEKRAGLPLEKCPAVLLLNEALPRSAMPSLYGASDAFVLPAHGEAYGPTLLEALSCELPVITTAWGGPLEFLDNENSYLIEFTGLVPAPIDQPCAAGHLCAEPSLEHLRHLMREVYAHPEEARKRSRKGRQTIVEHWDWSVMSPRWKQEFQRLLA